LIGEETRAGAGDAILVDTISVYGRMQGGAVYELLGMTNQGFGHPPDWVVTYEAALDAYTRRDWSGATNSSRLSSHVAAPTAPPAGTCLKINGGSLPPK